MSASPRRNRAIAALAVVPVSVLLAGGLVWQSSYAAFSARTENSGNSWSTGRVALSDDDRGAAAVTVENMVPGDTGSKCIVVTSNSNVPGEVRTYVEDLLADRGLENRIQITIESGTGGTFNDCTGFIPEADGATGTLAQLATADTDWASGANSWDTTGTPGESRTYRATWTFDTTGMTQAEIDALQGARTGLDVVWELQTTDN
ncbi:hypothetical protein QWJ90_09360 [Microbacterium oryzae]|uniref:hypothetical protein n=1 Tax=Microbacterium oryzae TaxID=743009 RepID=UPI0025B1C049|nr:hypothetical protein [Microbacterium oryzae]MDN3311136.1 hypothetical protein [Microbacterium oryzae]